MYRLQKAKLDHKTAAQKVAARQGQYDLLGIQRKQAEGRLAAAEAQLAQFDLVQILLQETSDYARQQAKGRLEEIVSSAINIVFGVSYKFIIKLENRSNRPECDYYLDKGGVMLHLKPPDYDNSGGYIDVINMALRLGVGELTGTTGTLLMDEIGKHVSEEYAPNVAFFLKEYSERFQRQIILITHNTQLASVGDVAIGVREVNGVSKVTQL